MPVIKSAKKRVRQEKKRRQRHQQQKRQMRAAIKAVENSVEAGELDDIDQKLNEAKSQLDKGVKRNFMHKNKAARKKSQLAKLVAEAKS